MSQLSKNQETTLNELVKLSKVSTAVDTLIIAAETFDWTVEKMGELVVAMAARKLVKDAQ